MVIEYQQNGLYFSLENHEFTHCNWREFFNEIKPVIEKKFQTEVVINIEKDSNEQKAAHALPGKPAIVIF